MTAQLAGLERSPDATIVAGRPTSRVIGALIALSVSTFLYVTTETLPIGLLRPIGADLDAGDAAVGMLVTYYGLVVVVASLPLTQFTRKLPRRQLLCALLLLLACSTALSALAGSYAWLLSSRLISALSQAVFWSVVVPTAASLVPRHLHGRTLAGLFGGSSLAGVLGVPVGTWLGMQLGWRAPFFLLAAVAAVAALAVALLLPGTDPTARESERGAHPDLGQYVVLTTAMVLVVGGTFTFFTYVALFLTDSADLSASLVSAALLARGLAGLIGVVAGGWLVDRSPGVAVIASIAVQAGSLGALWLFPHQPLVVFTMIAATGFSFAALTTALASRVLDVAPGRLDLATSGTSMAVNVGITGGALLGGLLLEPFGARSTALSGGLLSAASLILVVAAAWRARSSRRAR